MSKAIYPLATSTWDEREYEALQAVIASNRFTMGPRVAQFEEDFARFVGAQHAVMVNSGSSANLAMIAAAVLDPDIDLGPGDEVIVTAVSWATTYYPLTQYGLVPRFVDIDLDTLNLDPALAADAVTNKTKAILAVNLLGNPNDFARLREITESHDLVLFEDNCESLGAAFGGRQAGTFGAMGTYSGFFSHHISTMEGGLITTDDERLFQMLRSLRAHGWTRDLPDKNLVYDKSGDTFDDLFRFVLPGYNLRPLEMSGALGTEQLKKLPALLEGRSRNASYFRSRFGNSPDVRLQREVGHSSWFGLSILLEGRLAGRRRDVVNAFSAAGIETRPIVAGNFTRNPVMAYLNGIVPDALPAADRVHFDGLFLGNHHYPVESAIDRAFDVLASL